MRTLDDPRPTGALGSIPNLTATWFRLWDLQHFDVLHFPATYIPTPMYPPPGAKVLTFFDMQHEFYPHFFSRPTLARRRLLYRLSIKSAQIVIAATSFTAQTLRDRYQVPNQHLRVIPLEWMTSSSNLYRTNSASMSARNMGSTPTTSSTCKHISPQKPHQAHPGPGPAKGSERDSL